jgi:protein-glutamine gamma-glutamyltransferase
MLKIRTDMKEVLILLVFALLLAETLMATTILVVVAGALLVWFKIRPGVILRNIITLGVFISYWIKYGKVFDPEVGLNFLTTIIVMKLLEKETMRDRYMIFYGLLLLISAGSLFEKNLTYVMFFTLSFFILISDFYQDLKLSWSLRDFIKSLLWVLPFTAMLFFFSPRMISPFQIQRSDLSKGQIGYTPEVNLRDEINLSSNPSVVFQAELDQKIGPRDLYWRGNTLSFTDGWSWPLMPGDQRSGAFDKSLSSADSEIEGVIHQKITVLERHDFFFALDSPLYIFSQKGGIKLKKQHTLYRPAMNSASSYRAVSSRGGIFSEDLKRFKNINSGLGVEEKAWIQENFRSKDLLELVQEIKNFFQRENFTYSLTPGKVDSFLNFMTEKKIGHCTHYSSAVGIILRQKKIPVRLVSGFLGGNYNSRGNFYLITQNDAHVWVEAHYQGKWQRIDPTDWIAPDRVNLGGEAFINQVATKGKFGRFNFLNSFFLGEFRQSLSHWNFAFYQWLEQMDYYGQLAFLARFHLKREWILSIIPLILLIFLGLYYWFMSRSLKKDELAPLWSDFRRRLERRGIRLSYHSLAESELALKNYQGPERESIEKLWHDLIRLSFSHPAEDGRPDSDLPWIKRRERKQYKILKKRIRRF